MKPLISKEPENVPELTTAQIDWLTDIVFYYDGKPEPCDAVFVFGGTHPGHWEKTIEAYRSGLSSLFIVTGGVSPTGKKHAGWKERTTPESHVIRRKILEAGVPEECILYEDSSKNSMENVLYALEVFDFTKVKSLLVVTKEHVAGRQIRTLQKHLPETVRFVPYGFSAVYSGGGITRDNWHLTHEGRSRVWGEYLRICKYGDAGHLRGIPVEERML
ncbi:YdcF family protein [Fictibacillus halophilus]|uniref:YdcF family protein n=1 Tax=Fictibacillus halophilus TaxID=1610490 RepID=UPI001CFA175E|nr:YdcF family protein [Fictibacillus halophilus]